MRIRVTTRADLFEERKQQHIERGYRIEDERPIPVNGLCSFIAVSEIPDSDGIDDLVAQALSEHYGSQGDDCPGLCGFDGYAETTCWVRQCPGEVPSH